MQARTGFSRWGNDRSGNVATLLALIAPVGIALGAIAVDSASLYQQRREAQALADLAAITAAAHIDRPEAAAMAALRDNGIGRISVIRGGRVAGIDTGGAGVPVTLRVEPGRYIGEPGTAVVERFVEGARPYDAVRVTLTRSGTQYFSAAMQPPPRIETSAVANAPAQAAFSIGSRLLGLDGGLLNAVLSGLTGSQVSLSLMDYQALAGADIDVFSFSEALATELRLDAATYGDVGEAEATLGQIASVIAELEGTKRTAAAAAKLFGRATAGAQTRIRIDRLVSLGRAAGLPIGHPPAGMGASVSALDMLGAGAALATGSRQVELDLAANLPGLMSATVELAIGEPPQSSPWFTLGQTGDVVRTAQTRLKIVAELKGPGGLLGSSIKVPLYFELAHAEGRLTDIACSGKTRVAVSARPGVAALRLAEVGALDDFSRDPAFSPAQLVLLPAVSVTGGASATIANVAATALAFSENDIATRAIKSVSTKNLTRSLTRSLLDNPRLEAKVSGLGAVSATAVTKAVGNLLDNATPAIDQLLDGVLQALGVRLGEADIRVTGVRCGRSVLVQ